jgi:hypothetical protein
MSHENNHYQTFNHGLPAGYSAGTEQAPTMRIGGGLTRIQMGAQRTPQQYPPAEANRVYGSAVRHVHNPAAVDHRGSVLATRRSVNGRDTVCLQPGNEGSRTHIASAVRDGLLIETSPGYYADAT